MMNKECCDRFKEYGACTPGVIKQIAPTCKDKAVIPSVTVESVEGMKGLAGCFVHVIANNTTYYIDDKHRITIIWAGPVEIAGYDYVANPRNLRSQSVYDFINNIEIYYNSLGEYRIKMLQTSFSKGE